MGEQLLFLLFILFSVISALLERRKRKRALEETQRREAGKPDRAEGEVEDEVAEEEQAWPFPMGGDPFGLPRPRRSAGRPRSDIEPDFDVDEEAPAPKRKPGMLERLEREARQIEEQAKLVEAQAKESARQIQEVQPRRRVQEVVREEIARVQAQRPGTRATKKRWQVTATSARDAIVYAEILGPPKAEREDGSGFS